MKLLCKLGLHDWLHIKGFWTGKYTDLNIVAGDECKRCPKRRLRFTKETSPYSKAYQEAIQWQNEEITQ